MSDHPVSYTENDPRMHDLYERAQGGQLTLDELNRLTDDELIYLAGHNPPNYFEIGPGTADEQQKAKERRSKLEHNSRRATMVLERRWVDRSEQANRDLLAESTKIAVETSTWTRHLTWATFGLAVATLAMAIATIVIAAHGT